MNAKDTARASKVAEKFDAELASERNYLQFLGRGDMRVIVKAIRELQKLKAKP